MNRVRLEGEAMRDAMLAAAGTLNRAVGGPRVLVPLEPEVYDLIFTEDEPDGLWKATPDASRIEPTRCALHWPAPTHAEAEGIRRAREHSDQGDVGRDPGGAAGGPKGAAAEVAR